MSTAAPFTPLAWPSLSFRAMGTDCLVVVESGPGAAATLVAARTMIDGLDARLSRFRPDSEVSRLNAGGGGRCSALVAPLLDLAFRLRDSTGGLFDPTLLTQLEHAGYDRAFDDMPGDGVYGKAGGLDLDPDDSAEFDGRQISLPPGVRLDLGGIAKGWAADEVVATLGADRGMLVDLGGDIAVSPPGPFHWTWPVGTTHAEDLDTVLVARGAIATSTTTRRRWRSPDGVRHHVIDPRTRLCAETDLGWVTAFHASCATAEVWAKAVLIAGSDAGTRLAHRHGIRILASPLGCADFATP